MSNNLVSVIVPIYKTEKYLTQCLESLVSQSYEMIEIICVDDCSPDDSLAIVNEFIERDKRVKIVRQDSNMGLAEARNSGLAAAKGDYIAFVDSDDWVAKDYIEVLYGLAISNDADICVCSYARTLVWSEDVYKQDSENILKYSGRDAARKMFSSKDYQTDVCMTVAWNKLFRREVIQDIKFPKGKLYEDQPFALKAYYNSKTVVVTNRKLYFYRRNHSSITMQKFNIRILDELDLYDDMKMFLKSRKDKYLYDVVVSRKIPLAISRYVAACYAQDDKASKKAYKHVTKEIGNYFTCKTISWSHKFKALLFVISSKLFVLYGLDVKYREEIG